MKRKLLCFVFVSILCILGCSTVSADQSTKDLLGADFIDRLVFFGESTTSHLAVRSIVKKEQVWANSSGTARLDSTLADRPIRDPRDGHPITPVELAARESPECIVLSFGLNGIMDFDKNTDGYLKRYQKLIDALAIASPDTRFLIQSVYPVADAAYQSDWQFSVTPREINQKIDRLNRCMKVHCETLQNADFVDTSINLKDVDGFLRHTLTTDGIHLNEAAYEKILDRLRMYGKSLCGTV